MTPESAETVALQALAWLVGNDELLPVFLGSSGVSSDALRAQARDPSFLGAVLEFITMNDAWVTAFCDTAGLDYAAPLEARRGLPGGDSYHWT